MARFISTTISAGQSIHAEDLWIKSLLLSATASADCQAVIKGAGNVEIILCANKGTTAEYPTGKSGSDFNTEYIQGPVTLDLTGTGAFFRISF